RAHLHDFFGSRETDAHSTPASLVGTDTTCQNRKDTAAYWAPALFRDGEPVPPTKGVAYYRPGVGVDPSTVEPYPEGLVIVAGDQTATAPQPLDVAAWHCGASPVLHSDPPECPRTAPLGVRVAFPDCWDGERLDSDDHQSHMAYSATGACPASHPVPVPQLVFEVHYPVWGDPSGLELASGGVRSVHADFVQAWAQATLEREARTCLNREKVCGVVSNRATDGPPASHVAVAALPVGGAQLALEQLAARVAGQDVGEVDRLRHLEAGDVLASEGDELLGGGIGALSPHDDGLHRLAPPLVGHTDDGHVG